MGFWKAEAVLDSIERHYSRDYIMLREKYGVFPDINRVDAIMIPISSNAHCMKINSGETRERNFRGKVFRTKDIPFFERLKIIGIEVKISPQDFKKGLNTGQFERYDSRLNGLFIATTKDVCKTKDIPINLGHLLVTCISNGKIYDIDDRSSEYNVTCKRNPTYKDAEYTVQDMWRLLFKVMEKSEHDFHEKENQFKTKLGKFGRMVSERLVKHIKNLESEVIK